MNKVQQMQDRLWSPVVEKLIASLEAGVTTGKWEKPWVTRLHTNIFSKKAYQGGNQVRLMFSGEECPYWATPHQWMQNGYRIDGAKVTGWIYSVSSKKDDDGNIKFFLPKIYNLINGSRIEGFEWEKNDPVPELPEVQAYFDKHGIKIVHDDPANRAFYSTGGDYINMPPINLFKDNIAYYAVLAHEAIHWTSHKDRVNRDLSNYARDIKARAYEELIAEFGAAMVGAALGISTDVREDHLQYLASWLKALKEDKTVLQRAVVDAAKAVEYLSASSTPDVE